MVFISKPCLAAIIVMSVAFALTAAQAPNPEPGCTCVNANSTQHATASYCIRKADGSYLHPYSCHRFVICSNGLTYNLDCAPSAPNLPEAFDPTQNACDYVKPPPEGHPTAGADCLCSCPQPPA